MSALHLFRPDDGTQRLFPFAQPQQQSLFADDPPDDPTVAEVIALYLRHSQVEGTHCAEARAERERVLGRFADYRAAEGRPPYGELHISRCRAHMLSDWIEAQERWKSSGTRRAKANVVKACFAWAADGERIYRNPFKAVSYEEAERREELPDSTIDQVGRLTHKHYERALRFLRLTGARLSELCAAVWQDMRIESGIWVIRKHKSRAHTKKDKIVALVPEAIEVLEEIRRERASCGVDELVFLNTRGTAWNRRTLGQHLRRLKKRHGITSQATLHGIRHRAATAAIAAGAPLKLVSQQLGHSSTAVTEKYYVHLGEEQIPEIARAIRQGLPRKEP